MANNNSRPPIARYVTRKAGARKGAVSPIREPYPNFLAVAEVTRRRPDRTIAVAIRHSPALRRFLDENPALQAVLMNCVKPSEL